MEHRGHLPYYLQEQACAPMASEGFIHPAFTNSHSKLKAFGIHQHCPIRYIPRHRDSWFYGYLSIGWSRGHGRLVGPQLILHWSTKPEQQQPSAPILFRIIRDCA